MRFSRTDVAPMLVIVAGVAIGASLTFGPALLFAPADQMAITVQPTWSPELTWSTSEDVSRPVRPRTGRAVPVWSPDGVSVVFESTDGRAFRVRSGGGEPQLVAVSPDGQWISYESDVKGKARVLISVMDLESKRVPVILSADGSFWSRGGGLQPDDIESIEVLKGDAAVEYYGTSATGGVIRVTVREKLNRR